MSFDPVSYLMGTKASGGGGGGSQGNWAEIIEGTLAAPVPTERYFEIAEELNSGNATMKVSGSVTGLGAYILYAVSINERYIRAFNAIASGPTGQNMLSMSAFFPESGEEAGLEIYAAQSSFETLEVTNLTGLFHATDPVTTTIIHHPLPSGT